MIRSTLAIAVAIAFAVPTMGTAQTNDELTQRIADLEARLNQMEEEQVSYVNTMVSTPACSADVCSDVGCGSCGDTGCRNRSWCCPEAGAFGEIELLYMSLKDTDEDINQDKPYSGTRTTVGYMNDKGRGFQIRYFEIGIAEADAGGDRFELDTLDFEYLSRFKLGCNWRGDIGMGLRLMDLDTAEDGEWQDAVGPVIGVNLIGEMTNNLSVYGRVRQAFVYGNNSDDGGLDDSVVPMSELAFGLEYARQLNSSEMYLRGGVEGQVFESAQDQEEDISIIGLGMSVGFRR